MYATDRRQTDVRRASSLNAPYPRGGHNNILRQHVCPGYQRRAVQVRSDGTNSAIERHTHTLASKIDNESDAAGNLNCGNSARKWRSTSKLLPGCHARHCCSLVLLITVLVKDELRSIY